MRVMVIVKANADSEAGAAPGEADLLAMNAFNEELAAAGVLLTGEGLLPSSRGARVHFNGAERTVVPGPFASTTELVAGFWILRVASLDEAVSWMRRAPMPGPGEVVLEIRPLAEAEDFGDAYTDEVRAGEDRVRERLAGGD